MQPYKLSRQRIGIVTTMKPTRIAATALVLLMLTTRVAQPTDPTKDNPIEELMELTGSVALAKQTMRQMLPLFREFQRKANPDIPDDMLPAIEEEFLHAFDETLPEFIVGMVAIYERYFTTEDIEALIAFYKTEIGRKLIRVKPQLNGEKIPFALAWGRDVLAPLVHEKVHKRLHDNGYDP